MMRIILAIACMVSCWPALAHDAPTGWTYPFKCCSNHDCRPVDGPGQSRQHEVQITTSSQGYVIGTTGEVIPYSSTTIHPSQDDGYHWCSQGGKDNGKSLCLFVPASGV